MAGTQIREGQIEAEAVGRSELNATTVGSSVIKRVIAGTNVTISSTGADVGTGDVTINAVAGGTSGIEILSVAPVAGSVLNDYAPSGITATTSHIIFNTTLIQTDNHVFILSGLTTGGANRRVSLVNNSLGLIVVEPQNASSAAANRFALQDTIFMLPGDVIELIYDTVNLRWLKTVSDLMSKLLGNSGAAHVVDEDFAGRVTSATAGAVGLMSTFASGTGGAVANLALGVSGSKSFGEITLATGTTATGRAAVVSGINDTAALARGAGFMLTRLMLPILSTAAERFRVTAGIVNSITSQADPLAGVGWNYSDVDSANWQVWMGNTAKTRVASGLVATANQYVWLGLFVNAAWTRVDGFYSTNGLDWTQAPGTNLNQPSNTSQASIGVAMFKSVGVTNRVLNLDKASAFYGYTR